jgi:hypothetical protein
MPEPFDTLLAELAQQAGSTVQPAGADAARRRGRQRALRKRAATSVLSVVLAGAVGGVVLGLAAQHGPSPAPPVHRTTAPVPSFSEGSPSTSPTGPDIPSASAGTAPATATGDLHTIVSGAWTPMSAFPVQTAGWKANADQPSINTADRQWFYSCFLSPTFGHLGTLGYQEKTFTATDKDHPGSADQVLFFFPSVSAAEQALTTVRADYAQCPEQTEDRNGTPMTGTLNPAEAYGNGYAWAHTYENAHGTAVSPTLTSADEHEFFVQRGNVLELFRIDGEGAGSLYVQSGDLTFLAALESNLCLYGGQCPGTQQVLTAAATASGPASITLGGGPLTFAVRVTNHSTQPVENVSLRISQAFCTCVRAPVPLLPGTLQYQDPSTSAWKDVYYDSEGTGMDYMSGGIPLQVPAVDVPPGRSVTFTLRLRLDPGTVSANRQLVDGTSAIDIALIHARPASEHLSFADTIGPLLAATLAINVNVH